MDLQLGNDSEWRGMSSWVELQKPRPPSGRLCSQLSSSSL